MAKYKIYKFEYMGSFYESDSMKDCVHQYYLEKIPGFPMEKFDARFETDRTAWEKFFRGTDGRIVEIEVEGG